MNSWYACVYSTVYCTNLTCRLLFLFGVYNSTQTPALTTTTTTTSPPPPIHRSASPEPCRCHKRDEPMFIQHNLAGVASAPEPPIFFLPPLFSSSSHSYYHSLFHPPQPGLPQPANHISFSLPTSTTTTQPMSNHTWFLNRVQMRVIM